MTDTLSLTPAEQAAKIAEIIADKRNHMHEAIDGAPVAILYVLGEDGNYQILNYGDVERTSVLLSTCTMRLTQAIRELIKAPAEAEKNPTQ